MRARAVRAMDCKTCTDCCTLWRHADRWPLGRGWPPRIAVMPCCPQSSDAPLARMNCSSSVRLLYRSARSQTSEPYPPYIAAVASVCADADCLARRQPAAAARGQSLIGVML